MLRNSLYNNYLGAKMLPHKYQSRHMSIIVNVTHDVVNTLYQLYSRVATLHYFILMLRKCVQL